MRLRFDIHNIFLLVFCFANLERCLANSEDWWRLQCEILELKLQSKDLQIFQLEQDLEKIQNQVQSFHRIIHAAERNIEYMSNKLEQQKAIIRRNIRPKSWS